MSWPPPLLPGAGLEQVPDKGSPTGLLIATEGARPFRVPARRGTQILASRPCGAHAGMGARQKRTCDIRIPEPATFR